MKITRWAASTFPGKRKGAFDLLLPSGMELCGCSLVTGDNGDFVGLPQSSYKAKDGTTKYQKIVKFPDKEKSEQFNRMALKAIQDYLDAPQGQEWE